MESGLLSMAQQFSGLPMEALIGGPLNAAANANAAMAMTQTKFMLDTCFTRYEVEATDKVDGVAADPANNVKAVIGTPAIPKHDQYQPIMVKMSLTRSLISPASPLIPANAETGAAEIPATPAEIQTFDTVFELPMLTIVPLNSLAVETVDVNFEMEVKSSFSEEQTDKSEKAVSAAASFEAKVGYGPFSASVKGSASYDSKDSSEHNTHYQKSNSAKYTVNVHAGQLPLPEGVKTIIDAFAKSIQPIQLQATPAA